MNTDIILNIVWLVSVLLVFSTVSYGLYLKGYEKGFSHGIDAGIENERDL